MLQCKFVKQSQNLKLFLRITPANDNAKPKFDIDQMVKAKHHGKLYSGKILEHNSEVNECLNNFMVKKPSVYIHVARTRWRRSTVDGWKKIVHEVSLVEKSKFLPKALANELVNGDTHSSPAFTTTEKQFKHQKMTSRK